jgi:primosomal protein N' (replication factor Y)
MRYYILQVDNREGFYTYRDENDDYEIGEQVIVQFGNRKLSALILAEDNRKEFEFEIKNIMSRTEGAIRLPSNLIELFLWMSRYYVVSMRDVLTSAYPQNLKVKYSERCSLAENFESKTEEEETLKLYLYKKKEITYSTLTKNFDKTLVDKLIRNKKILLHKKVIKKEDRKNCAKSVISPLKTNILLNDEQQNCLDTIENGEKKFYLLKGITGSGKTEVYMKLIREALKKGEGSIFLVPEISLTPQMIKRIENEFEGEAAVLHSRLTAQERSEEWLSIYRGEKQVVLGVRSAVFAPVKNLKYIIVDEEHESSYKQDSSPRYDARYVAFKRAEIENLKVILGSATPSIESYYYAKNGVFELIKINNRYNSAELPALKLVDMRESENHDLSRELLEDSATRLRRGEQILYLLNRKGYSTFIQCTDCGHTEECPHCSVTMNYYKSEGRYRCNYCGYSKRASKICSNCGSDKLRFSGHGTEKLEDSISEYFPEARILRVDAESTKGRDSYKEIYDDFLEGKYDIILGTQIISKGLHFPGITLVGIITADTILHFPDFRAAEKTFQLIYQAAGRAGRGDKKGEVLIQTYNKEHYVIEKILNNDYEGLYNTEIENRKIFAYPPFGRIINIVLSSGDEKYLEEEAKKFRKLIDFDGIDIYGPMPCAISRVKNRFRYQIFVKGNRKLIREFKKGLYEKIQHSKNNKLRITIDVDPINLM